MSRQAPITSKWICRSVSRSQIEACAAAATGWSAGAAVVSARAPYTAPQSSAHAPGPQARPTRGRGLSEAAVDRGGRGGRNALDAGGLRNRPAVRAGTVVAGQARIEAILVPGPVFRADPGLARGVGAAAGIDRARARPGRRAEARELSPDHVQVADLAAREARAVAEPHAGECGRWRLAVPAGAARHGRAHAIRDRHQRARHRGAVTAGMRIDADAITGAA